MNFKSYLSRRKPVYGFGINDADYAVNQLIDGKQGICQYYRQWSSMLLRCYSPKCHVKQPTYIGCTVVEEWKSFMTFRSWMEEQKWQGNHLDKDIIYPDNKIYSPDNCCFVPKPINNLLTDSAAARGDLPQGVNLYDGRLQVRININGKLAYIGPCDCKWEGHRMFCTAKAVYIRIKAMELYEQGYDDRIITGLLRHAADFDILARGACEGVTVYLPRWEAA